MSWKKRTETMRGYRILTAPYEEREGWALNVMKVGGTLYFEEFISDAKIQEK